MTFFLRSFFSAVALTFSGIGLLQAQIIEENLVWEAPRELDKGLKRLSFEGASYTLADQRVPRYCMARLLPDANVSAVDAQLLSYTTAPLSREEKRWIEVDQIAARPGLQSSIGVYRDEARLSVCFTPLIVENGEIKKITSFRLSYQSVADNASREVGRFKKSAQAANSVLAQEGWHKIAVSKTAIHKITPQFLIDNGIGASAPIANLRVVGNGTGMLPLVNNVARPDDLLEVPLKVVDANNDGIFNGNDYALFYARSAHQWDYDSSSNEFKHDLNVFRDLNYYFISTENGGGARIAMAPANSQSPTVSVTSFDDYAFVEEEERNLVGTGSEWFGDEFDQTLSYNYDFSFPDLVSSEPLTIEVSAVARVSSNNNTSLKVFQGVNPVLDLPFTRYSTLPGANFANRTTRSSQYQLSSDNFTLRLEYQNAANPSGVAWLDYIRVQARRNLNFRGQGLYFRDARSVQPGAVAVFEISNANANMEVWEVTDHNGVEEIPLTLNGNLASFIKTADVLREYVAFSGSGFDLPTYIGVVAPQNLHGDEPVEMIIVTHKNFRSAAERLAQFHEEFDGLSVKVVSVDEVYNEFSSGGQDVTAIRDYARHNYVKANSQQVAFDYLFLLGDASYDYKDRLSNNTNYVPVRQMGSSLSLYNSSITDDYFAYLDPPEGGDLGGDLMDLGVGRVTAQTLAEANAYVNKAIHYASGEGRFGDWRNKILMMADDVDDPSFEEKFVRASEGLVKVINGSKAFNVEKVYEDAYQQESTTGSETYPEASADMFRKIQQGVLVTNYIGHGGEIGLASEKLLDLADVKNWSNFDALTLFCSITCEFTRFDDPKRTSAGELMALNANGGAIGLLTTTRVVYVDPAIDLSESVFKVIFQRPGNQPKTLGQIFKDTKNEPGILNDASKHKFSLIGDPALRLAIPYYNIQTNSINGKNLSSGAIDTLGALSKVSVSGQVNDFSGSKITSFNGIANVSVYDKPTAKQTLRNDGEGKVLSFTQQNNLIYRGKVEVKAGDFGFEFIVPKDISYSFGNGKISLYAYTEQMDAAGYMDTVVVGGFSNEAASDEEGPEVALFINDDSFVRGGITDKDPELFAQLSDSSGINTVGTGIGHDLVAILDGKTDQSYVLNQYYEADLNSYQSGVVRYPFYDLEEGEHSLELQVFDVHNNVTKAYTEFIVADSEEIALKRVLNYPNPFTTYTEFQFEHNRSGQPLEVQVQVFTVSGKLVKTINQLVVPTGNRVSGISWNGLDDYGDKIGKGVYVYRVKVRSQLDNSQADKYEKLVILR